MAPLPLTARDSNVNINLGNKLRVQRFHRSRSPFRERSTAPCGLKPGSDPVSSVCVCVCACARFCGFCEGLRVCVRVSMCACVSVDSVKASVCVCASHLQLQARFYFSRDLCRLLFLRSSGGGAVDWVLARTPPGKPRIFFFRGGVVQVNFSPWTPLDPPQLPHNAGPTPQ